MNVALPPRLTEFVERKVASGTYSSASQVIESAVALLEELDRENEAKLQWLRADIAVGMAEVEAGEVVEFDEEEMMRLGRQRIAPPSGSGRRRQELLSM